MKIKRKKKMVLFRNWAKIKMLSQRPIEKVYIDDRAIRYNHNWLEIARRLSDTNSKTA